MITLTLRYGFFVVLCTFRDDWSVLQNMCDSNGGGESVELLAMDHHSTPQDVDMIVDGSRGQQECQVIRLYLSIASKRLVCFA